MVNRTRLAAKRQLKSHLATTSNLWRSSADILWGSSFRISTKSSSTAYRSRPSTMKQVLNLKHITLTLLLPYLSMVETVRVVCSSAKTFNHHKHLDNQRQNPDLCDLIWNGVVQGTCHAQIHAILVELRWNLRHLHRAQVLLQVRWIKGGS